MQKLYFVRHGQSRDNAAGVWSHYDAPLTELGREQARATGKKIRQQGLSFDTIIASPQPRAHETAQLIAREISHPVDAIELLELLVERNWGSLTSTPGDAFFGGTHIYKDIDTVPGAEKLADMQQRAARALAILRQRPEASILIVGHGTFGRALRRELAGLPHTHEYRTDFPAPETRIQNAEIVELI